MVLDFIINMILLIVLISLFNLTRYLLKIRKLIKMYKDNPNIQGISIVNGEVKIMEKAPESQEVRQVIPTVTDEVCGKEIAKNEAYRMVVDGEEHYFCSWECREAFIKKKREEE